jgi:hypothetical protein
LTIGSSSPFIRIPGALVTEDVEYLKSACVRHVSAEGIPCYVLLDHLESAAYLKIKHALERELGEPVYYLNDFYMYTDGSFGTGWHMDTELFTFARAVNAWVLLSPDRVCGPLAFIDGINDSAGQCFHSVQVDGDECVFGDYHSGESVVRSLTQLESTQICTPEIDRGDILVLDPKRFHKTDTTVPKHALVLKFVFKGPNGFCAPQQVDPCLWPEVELFNDLLRDADPWEKFVAGLRRMLGTEQGRKNLSAGFYPEKFDFYRQNVMSL